MQTYHVNYPHLLVVELLGLGKLAKKNRGHSGHGGLLAECRRDTGVFPTTQDPKAITVLAWRLMPALKTGLWLNSSRLFPHL